MSIGIAGINQSVQAWAVRIKAFKHTSASQVIGSVATNGFTIGMGAVHFGMLSLIIGSFFGSLFTTMNLLRVCVRDIKESIHSFNLTSITKKAIEYRDFPFFSAPQHLMNALSEGLPVLLFSHFYGINVGGTYAFCVRILQAPMAFVLNPLRQVLFQKASETYNRGENLFSMFGKVTLGLMSAVLIPGLVLFFNAPRLFSWIFGNNWYDAGIFAKWLTLWLAVAFCNVPAVLFARILRQQRNLFVFESVSFTIRFSILLIGSYNFSPLFTIKMFSLAGFILNGFLIVWIGFLCFNQNNKRSYL